MSHKIQCTELNVRQGISLYHVGPALDHGPLPTIFYFALSGPDSLTKDPYNQPIQFLAGRWIRFFSLTLPAHENNLDPTKALGVWAEEMEKGIDPFEPFFDQALAAVEFGIRQKLIDPTKLGLAGLSRGGLIASHLAARESRFKAVLQFAPVTTLSKAREFADLKDHPLVRSLDVAPLAEQLADKPIRFYIGNKDTRVGTRSCFEFAMKLVEQSKHRSPPVELILSPSIGLQGHGTPPEIFKQGAEWLASWIG